MLQDNLIMLRNMYEMSQEENVKKSAEVTKAHVAKYCK